MECSSCLPRELHVDASFGAFQYLYSCFSSFQMLSLVKLRFPRPLSACRITACTSTNCNCDVVAVMLPVFLCASCWPTSLSVRESRGVGAKSQLAFAVDCDWCPPEPATTPRSYPSLCQPIVPGSRTKVSRDALHCHCDVHCFQS